MKEIMRGPQSPAKESFVQTTNDAIQKAVYLHDQAAHRTYMFSVILFIMLLIVLVF